MRVLARNHRRSLASGIAFIVLFSFAQAAGPPSAAADTVWHVPAQQFNMCGHSCGEQYGYDPATYQVVEFIVASTSPNPWVVTLNEVCSWNLNNGLIAFMEKLGYTYDRYISEHVGGECNNYGTAMFTLGSNASSKIQRNLTPYNGEPRALICRHKLTYAGPALMCETHVMPQQQNDEAYIYYVSLLSESISLVGGDFNKTPYSANGLAMINWYAHAYEVDPPNHPTYSTNPSSPDYLSQKIDYLFNGMNSIRAGNTSCNTWDFSDHCYYYGDFYFSS